MATLQSLSFAVFLLLLVVTHGSMALATSTLHDQCSRYAAGDKPSYDYCVWSLRRDRGSANADERGLAAIAARIARASARATGARIAELQGKEKVPARRDGLAACAKEYTTAVRRLGRAARHARRGGPRELQEAQTLLAEVLGAPARCDAAFVAAGQTSPLRAEDRGLDDAVGLAAAIMPTTPTPTTRA